jgi:isoleucyl-tRNA synthetase
MLVSTMREKLVEENKKVYWVPENVRDGRMGQWLEGARDWALSRNRYWGAPLPVWKSKETGEVFVPGSLTELQTRTKAKNKYFLVRHGETDANRKNMVDVENATASGTIDVILGQDKDLNANGVAQAKTAGEELSKMGLNLEDVVIVASPYKRTMQTAENIAEQLGIAKEKIVQEKGLQEWQVGKDNDGKSWSQFYMENPGVYYLYRMMKGADETKMDVFNRMTKVMNEMEEKYQGKTIILVSHKSPIACLISRNNGEQYELGTGNLPAWHNARNCEVIDFDFRPLPTDDTGAVNFHLPHIDNLKVYDLQGNIMKREGGVFDCWFESGSMPFAQFHYPFENNELFKKNFPADFIAEAQDQTRGWFYTMLVLGVGLFDVSPFRSVICSGLVMAGDGKKMSKSLKNFTDPVELIKQYGSDAMRYFELSSPAVKGENVKFTDLGIQQTYSKNIGRLMNVVSFYKMYATGNVVPDSTSEHEIDKYILARFKQVKGQVTKGFEELFLDSAFRPVEKFIDDLSVWYLRRSRDRFKSDDQKEKEQALQVCKYLLQSVAKMLAPVLPFTAEMIWQEVRDVEQPISVHLCTWGETDTLDEEEIETIENMEVLREMVSIILDERIKAGIKVRQPLASATFGSEKYKKILTNGDLVKEILDETNLRSLIFVASEKLCTLDTNITAELKEEGIVRELVRMIQDERKKVGLKVGQVVDIQLPESMSADEKKVLENRKEEISKECNLGKISFGETLKIFN